MGSEGGVEADDPRCGHCGNPFVQNEQPGHRKTYCTVKCRKAAGHMRRYHFRKGNDLDHASEDSERKIRNAAAWRERAKAEGRCSRCGRDNDRKDEGKLLCSNCLIDIKGGPT